MSDPIARPVGATAKGLGLALVLATAVGWGTLLLGGSTDAAGRMGIAVGGAVFALVSIGWGRGRRGWLLALAGAVALGGALLAHFWMRLGGLP